MLNPNRDLVLILTHLFPKRAHIPNTSIPRSFYQTMGKEENIREFKVNYISQHKKITLTNRITNPPDIARKAAAAYDEFYRGSESVLSGDDHWSSSD